MGEEKKHLGNIGRFSLVMALLSGALLLALGISVSIGSVSIPMGEVLHSVMSAAEYKIMDIFTCGGCRKELETVIKGSVENRILFGIRIPRVLTAALLGGALSVSGYLLQVFFRNPIAGPFVLGISSGAKMTVGITLIFLAKRVSGVNSMTLILAAFAGSLLVTAVVLLFSQRVRSMSMLLVIGIMVGYICGAVTDFCIIFAQDHDVVNLTSWSMGTFSGADFWDIKAAAIICLPAVLISLMLSKPISAYMLGEGYAVSMGVRIRPFRAALILLSSLLSACVTALAGPVSFVGIAVPHITGALLRSSKPNFVIPASFLCGAVFCVLCDLIARTVFAPTELAIGTVTSFFGAPVVIYMMIKRRRFGEGQNG